VRPVAYHFDPIEGHIEVFVHPLRKPFVNDDHAARLAENPALDDAHGLHDGAVCLAGFAETEAVQVLHPDDEGSAAMRDEGAGSGNSRGDERGGDGDDRARVPPALGSLPNAEGQFRESAADAGGPGRDIVTEPRHAHAVHDFICSPSAVTRRDTPFGIMGVRSKRASLDAATRHSASHRSGVRRDPRFLRGIVETEDEDAV